MPLSLTQKGAIGQFAFLATSLATGKGQVEIYSPAADNEGRDAEVRRHLKPAPAIGIQVKVTFSSLTKGGRAKYLDARFNTAANRVQTDPRLWYFFAYYDVRQLRLYDPAFLVPSNVFHKLGRMGRWRGKIAFQMLASLSPTSRDHWSPYRVAPSDLGRRLLEIIDEAPLNASSRALKLPSDSVVIGRARRRVARAKVGRAARAA
ncbi:MAG: hypothetical protein QOH92_1083 [Chloroflexota bacterium]|jgi:hypothetical protein|nr:hypothetical protein [Chloroflexota bacterium]